LSKRMLQVLVVLAVAPLSAFEVIHKTGLKKTTVYRYLAKLESEGFVEISTDLTRVGSHRPAGLWAITTRGREYLRLFDDPMSDTVKSDGSKARTRASRQEVTAKATHDHAELIGTGARSDIQVDALAR